MAENQQKKKVHITLVGAQADPIYNVIVTVNPDVVDFIYSNATAAVKDRIANEIDMETAPSLPLSATDLNDIMKRATDLARQYADCEVSINISGGTKIWSHFFDKAFASHPDCTILYIDQNNVLCDLTSINSRKVKLPLDLNLMLRLHGVTPLYSYRSLSEYDDADDRALAEIKKIFGSGLHRSFNKFFALNSKKWYERVLSEPEGMVSTFDDENRVSVSLKWTNYDINGAKNTAIDISLGDRLGRNRHYHLDSPNAAHLLFKSGWYEYQTAKELIGWPKAKQAWLNCTFKAKANNTDLNEVDIIISTGTKLIFVECKTQISNISDIDKFRTVIKNYGGLASKGIFVTKSTKKAAAKEKCLSHGILDIVIDNDTDTKQIYKLLDKELNEINSR